MQNRFSTSYGIKFPCQNTMIGWGFLHIKVMGKNFPQKHKARTDRGFKHMFGILKQWNNSQVRLSLVKPNEYHIVIVPIYSGKVIIFFSPCPVLHRICDITQPLFHIFRHSRMLAEIKIELWSRFATRSRCPISRFNIQLWVVFWFHRFFPYYYSLNIAIYNRWERNKILFTSSFLFF